MDSAFQKHNHNQCIDSALQSAQNICAKNGVKLTPIRERTLALVWQNHKPIGAYDLLALLAAEGFNSAPPTVYRALDFLHAQGLIHKIASSNTYIGCSYPDTPHDGHFLLCNLCNQVLEINTDQIQSALIASALKHDFWVQEQTVEVRGLCQHCQTQNTPARQKDET